MNLGVFDGPFLGPMPLPFLKCVAALQYLHEEGDIIRTAKRFKSLLRSKVIIYT